MFRKSPSNLKDGRVTLLIFQADYTHRDLCPSRSETGISFDFLLRALGQVFGRWRIIDLVHKEWLGHGRCSQAVAKTLAVPERTKNPVSASALSGRARGLVTGRHRG